MSGFSGDDPERSNAAGFPLMPQLLTRMSAGLDQSFLATTKATARFQLRVVQGFLEELMQSVTKMVMTCNLQH